MRCPKCASLIAAADPAKCCPVCTYPLFGEGGDAPIPATGPGAVPWEEVERSGVIAALLLTLREAFVRPGTFFRRVASSRNSFMALLYGLTVGSIGSLFSFLWTYYVITPLLALIPGLDHYTGRSAVSVAGLMFTPIIVMVKLIFATVYFHGLLALTRSNAQDYRATFRIMCYVQSAAALDCIPVIGSVVSPFWALYLAAIGISKVHNISMIRSCVIILLPIILMLAGLFVLAAGLLGAGIVLQNTFKDLLGLIRY